MELPVEKLRHKIIDQVKSNRRLVFTSPPGSGKSTLIPRFLAKDLNIPGQVVVLQPRRLAARSLANSVAKMTGTVVGEEIGYQVRGDSRMSSKTQISFRTVGLLLRQLVNDPELKNVSAIVIDEFHERSWQSDVILSLVKELLERRDDLYLVVMSATMEAGKVCQFLDNCPHLESDNKPYPIEMYYRHFSRQKPLWERASEVVREHLKNQQQTGDILVFMPGQFEIRKTADLLSGLKGIEVCQLHGSLPPDKQDYALQKREKRKIIISTNIAETSLTVEGVDTVVDAGFSRENIFDASRGLDTLSLQAISVFSAEQRSGRAGRLGPGTAYRLWSKEEHSRKPIDTTPEIQRVDTTEVLLALLAIGHKLEEFDWFESPDQNALKEGLSLLKSLGAVEDQKISGLGKLMAQFPAHPRIATMLLAAAQNSCYEEACRWAAIVSERSPIDKNTKLIDDSKVPSDLRAISIIWVEYQKTSNKEALCRRYKIHRGAMKTLDQVFRQFGALLKVEDNFVDDEKRLIQAVLSGFPDKLARRLDRGTLRYRFANGKVGELTRNSAVRDAEFIVPLGVSEINNSGSSKTLLSLALEVDYKTLEELYGEYIEAKKTAIWNEKTRSLEVQEIVTLGDFVLREKSLSETPESLAAEEILVDKIVSGELKLNNWNKDVDKWIKKVRWVSGLYPEKELLEYNEDEQKIILLEMCSGCRSYKDVKNLPVLDYFKNAMSWDEQNFVQEMTPEKVKLPSGRNMKLSYEEDGTVKGSGFIQDFYGMTETPSVAGGRVKVLLDMLAPNRRTIHITNDLEGFWDGVYKDIKSQLAGRYPKHNWI